MLTANTATLDPVFLRLKGSPYPEYNQRWFNFQQTRISTTAGIENDRVIHRHVYLEKDAIETRAALLELSIQLFEKLNVTKDPLAHDSYK